ncbi:IclR family transcriptional regulator [Halobaculum roseum]|uniref:IclR family transcriptional regulator n=1 Tax=Halobaculum roseum TaxID=2175149 RepID=A0ABD5MN72_9EURY|nr:IclR family transcriptional regulator [Halobaculum roseum]QZY01913.1 IclR family transcriptional regulator [Halobaculum roseum]
MANNGSQRTIGSVERSYEVLQELQDQEACGVSELATALGIPKSTVHKHLRTLVDLGYVRQCDGQYRVGFKLLEHGGVVRDRCRIYKYGRPKIEELVADVGEMALLSIRDEDRGVFLFRSNDRYNLKASLSMGARFNLHSNGAGKAMLAASDDEFVQNYVEITGLPAETPHTITEPDALHDELEAIRSRGYARNQGERETGIQAVSAAIRDDVTGDVGAISISVPTGSPAVDNLDDEYAQAVQRAASELSLQLTHS